MLIASLSNDRETLRTTPGEKRVYFLSSNFSIVKICSVYQPIGRNSTWIWSWLVLKILLYFTLGTEDFPENHTMWWEHPPKRFLFIDLFIELAQIA